MNKAKEIRASLKLDGINSRQVSVTEKIGGCSRAINITIKDTSIPNILTRVRSAAADKEIIDRDSRTNEILSGGNTFVFTKFGSSILPNCMTEKDFLEYIKN